MMKTLALRGVKIIKMTDTNNTNRLCGSCKNFIGFGDWNLCCTKNYGLCYATSYFPDCDDYEYNPESDWFKCPICGDWTTYYHRVGDASKLIIDGEEYIQEKFWYCTSCEDTVRMLLKNSKDEMFVWEADNDT